MKKSTKIKGIPIKHLQSILKIDSDSPSGLTWLPRKEPKFNLHHANKMVGCKRTDPNGYQSWVTGIVYKNKLYNLRCSRIIFLLHNGYLTEEKDVDHIDKNSLNNKVENLRECTSSENQNNRNVQKNNISGYSGVSWHKATQKWRVVIRFNCKTYYFGSFKDKNQAIQVAKDARTKLHEKYAKNQ